MKKMLFALIAAVFIAAQVLTPAAAFECGTTYTVQPKDNLSKIAVLCNTSVADLLALNPQITNPNFIRIGQVLRISGVAPATSTTDPWVNSSTKYSGTARVTLSATTVREDGDITVYISGFPPSSWVDYRLSQQGKDWTRVYDGIVEADGTDTITITMPTDADRGEYWVVTVTTTSQKEGVEVTSSQIYISY